MGKTGFLISYNEAEDEALLIGIRLAREGEMIRTHFHSDSQLVVQQVNGVYEARDE